MDKINGLKCRIYPDEDYICVYKTKKYETTTLGSFTDFSDCAVRFR